LWKRITWAPPGPWFIRSKNQIEWRWDLSTRAFGDQLPNANPDGDSLNYVFNLRFPGQYYDTESGLNYNYFRYYDPATGRYIESDPIGLKGGVSTYGYAGQIPHSNFDPLGLYCQSSGGQTHCEYPGGPIFNLPTQQGFVDFNGTESQYHAYDVQRKLGCASAHAVMRELINHPTPSPNAKPATPGGTKRNDATPFALFPADNFVTSYLTFDLRNGNQLVVNMTAPGSFFDPGYVAREVTNGVAHTYGEGTNWIQSSEADSLVSGFLPFGAPGMNDFINEAVWGAQMQGAIDSNSCGCK